MCFYQDKHKADEVIFVHTCAKDMVVFFRGFRDHIHAIFSIYMVLNTFHWHLFLLGP